MLSSDVLSSRTGRVVTVGAFICYFPSKFHWVALFDSLPLSMLCKFDFSDSAHSVFQALKSRVQ